MASMSAARRCCVGASRVWLAASSRVTGGGPAVRVASVTPLRVPVVGKRFLAARVGDGGSGEGGVKSSGSDGGGGGERELSLLDKMVKGIGYVTGFYGRSQTTIRAARAVYLATSEHTSQMQFYELCGLPDTLQSWFLVHQLHIWMLLVRAKKEGSQGRIFYNHIVRFFWDDVEHKILLMKVDDVTIKSESTRELNDMFYGLLFAYDEGLVKDDTVLASAVWRNLFHASKSTATAQDVAAMVEYIRREVRALDDVDTKTLLERGTHTFGPPPVKAASPPPAWFDPPTQPSVERED